MIEKFTLYIESRLGSSPSPDQLVAGRIARFSTNGRPDDTAGWAKMFPDGAGGIFGCWRQDINEVWQAHDPTTPEERERFRRKVEQARVEAEAIRRKEHADAIAGFKHRWDAAEPTDPNHAYLVRKGVKSYGIRQEGGNLLIPVRDIGGDLHGLQTIKPDGFKIFASGSAVAGNLFLVGFVIDGSVTVNILIAEGYATAATLHEATGFPVVVAFNAGNLKPVAEVMRARYPKATIIICADDDQRREGNPGMTQATEAAKAVGGMLTVPVFPDSRGDEDTDFNDMSRLSGIDAVRCCIGRANLAEGNAQGDNILESVIKRLAALPALKYDIVRMKEAKSLGMRLSTLDSAVKEARKGAESAELPYREVAPWPSPVDPANLLTDISTTIRRFIVSDEETADAVALWITMTWFMDVVRVAPLAFITAPEKRCGKTLLLSLMGRLSARAITASNISPAALYRTIEAWKPTILIDEADACMRENEELRGLINSGHTRDSAYVIRTVGEDFTPVMFSTWGAKAIAGIGHIAETLMDRAIILELRRKLPHEHTDKIRDAKLGLFDDLCSKLARFAEDCQERVQKARPPLPKSLNDRAQDNWEPLFQVAAVAGDVWLANAANAALKLSSDDTSPKSIGVELLSDVMEVFEEKNDDRISTADLIKALCDDDERPWATYNRGREITPRQVAGKLKGYGIASRTIRIGVLTAKGFTRYQFEEAVARYCADSKNLFTTPSENSRHMSQPASDAALCVTDANTLSIACRHTSHSSNELWSSDGDVTECYGNEKISETRELAPVKECDVVTDKTPSSGEKFISEQWMVTL